ncbi:uncharacterized protein [Diadema antillarum]|uniref:uncharacterized protein n=1 Tax=Diadema antillarum TaxID=105358 RepID=UPI003A893611
MASGFTPSSTPKKKCDECHSDVKSCQASYRLETEKNLCDECAIKHQDSIKGLADQVRWTCQKHTDKTAELFCVTHDYPICHVCAVISYHTDCKRDDINDVKKERIRQLVDLIRDAEERGNNLKQNDVEIHQMTNHLTMITEQVSNAADEEKQKILDDREKAEKRINAEYDEKVKKLNEERKERLKCTRDEAEQKLHKIRDKENSLKEQVDYVIRGLEGWKTKLVPGLEDLAASIKSARMDAENLIIKQENLMSDFHDVTREINEYLAVELSQEKLDMVKGEIDKIKFKRGSELLGEVEGLEKRWVKVRDIYTESSSMILLGCISSSDVATKDLNYVSIVRLDKKAHEITKLRGIKPVCYNALSDGGHVFGTADGKLMVYDQLWNYARTIDTKSKKSLKVTVNKDGMILAAQNGGSSIFVYSPKDGKCLQTINLADDMPIRALKTMSTGDVIVLNELGRRGSAMPMATRLKLKRNRHNACPGNPAEEEQPTDHGQNPAEQPTTMSPDNQVTDNDNELDCILAEKICRALFSPTVMAALVKAVKEAVIEDVTQRVYESLRLDIESKEREIGALISQMRKLQQRLDEVDDELDDQEQYSRRHCLKIHGIAERPSENTDDVVIQFAKDQLDVDIKPTDIDRHHRLARQNRHGRDAREENHGKRKPNAIIVRFSTYNARTWTYDGRITALTKNMKKVAIHSEKDLEKLDRL